MITTLVPFRTIGSALADDVAALRDAIAWLFDGAFVRAADTAMAADVRETADEAVVTVNVPGVAPEKLTVSATTDRLVIGAELPDRDQGATWLVRERPAGRIRREIALPFPVDVDGVRAAYENGVLTVTAPKAAMLRPRRVTVEALPAMTAAMAA